MPETAQATPPTWDQTEDVPAWEDTSELAPPAAQPANRLVPLNAQLQVNPYAAARAQLPAGVSMGPFGPVDPMEGTRVFTDIPGAISKAGEQLTQPLADMFVDWLHRTQIDPSAQPDQPLIDFAAKAEQKPGPDETFLEASARQGLNTLSGFTTPRQAAMLPFLPFKAVQAYFGTEAAAALPQSFQEIAQAQTPGEFGSALTGFGANLTMAGLMGRQLTAKKTYAERIRENQRQFEETGQVPQGGEAYRRGDVQQAPPGTPAEAREEGGRAEVLLAPHLENNRSLGLGHQADFVDDFGTADPENISVARAGLPQIDENGDFMRPGRITISRAGLEKWLKTVPKEKQAGALAAMMTEEGIHATITPQEAYAYLNSLTAAERALGRKLYLGEQTAEAAGLNDVTLGHELLRQRMQRLLRMEPTEIAEVAGRQKWGRRSMEMLANFIRTMRELVGTRGAKAGGEMTNKILDRLTENVDAALQGISDEAPTQELGGEQPFSIRRSAPTPDEETNDPAEMAKVIGPVKYDGIMDFKLPGLKPKWQFTLTTPGRQTTFMLDVGSSLKDVWRKTSIKDYQFEHQISDQAEAERRWEEETGQPRSISRKREKQEELNLPPVIANVPRGTVELTPEEQAKLKLPGVEGQVERGAPPIEVPEEARKLKISPSDVDWEQHGQLGAYRPISDAEAASPEALGEILTKDARRGGSALPVSSSKRLVVLLDKSNGQVHIVSVYPHGRTGTMVTNPSKAGAKRPNVPLADVLGRYKPLYSILRDSPLKNFHQGFESLDDYQARFGEEAGQKSSESLGKAALATPVGSVEGQIQEPVYPEEQAEGPMPTDADLKAFHNFFEGEVPDTKSDYDRQVTMGAARANRQMVNAVYKAFQAEEAANPKASPEVNLESALSKLYEDLKAADTRTDFLKAVKDRLTTSSEGLARAFQEGRAPAPQGPRPLVSAPRDLTMLSRRPPTSVLPANIPEGSLPPRRPAPPVPEGSLVGARAQEPQTIVRTVTDELENLKDQMIKATKRGAFAQLLSGGVDSADNTANNLSRQVETAIRFASQKAAKWFERGVLGMPEGNHEVLAAANVLVESGFNPAKIPDYKQMIADGRTQAEQFTKSQNWRERREGRAWLRELKRADDELDYAKAHWNDPELQSTARRMKQELDEAYKREKKAGFNLRKDEDYLPHRYVMLSRPGEVLGQRYQLPQTFDTYYEALSKGPYLPATRDGATLVAHRVNQGLRRIQQKQWKEGLNSIDVEGTPLAIDAKWDPKLRKWTNPDIRYKEIPQGNGEAPLLVLDKYGIPKVMRSLTSHNVVNDTTWTKAAAQLSQRIKHTVLIGDFFHLARMVYYAASIMREKSGFRGGWSVLDIADKDVPEAVRKGYISQADADWGNESVDVTQPGGPHETMTRRQLATKFYKEMGANLGKIQDALYKDLVAKYDPRSTAVMRGVSRALDPTVGRYNRVLFDKLTRGLMAETVVREFERQHAARPDITPDRLMRDIAKDTNVYYGNLGRQGFMKAKWMQDLARVFWLAPQWVEGLVRKEATAYSRLSGASQLMGRRGLTYAGTTGRGIATGFGFMFGLTQAINLISRGQSTFQNKEKGHQLDAYIPGFGADNRGFFFSPMAVFNELLHDVYRLYNSKGGRIDEALRQIAGNKESPLFRAAAVASSGRTPTGEIITSTPGTLQEMGKQLLPLPITFGKFAQAAGHAVLPGTIRPVPAQTLQRQALSSLGLKVEPVQSPSQRVHDMAKDFMKSEGLEKTTGWQEIMTDEPSYTKLRNALRQDDTKGAEKIFRGMLAHNHTEEDVLKAMRQWTERGFTGNQQIERAFIQSLSPEEMDQYSQALEGKQALYEKFLDWYLAR